jgi:thiol-disulfide isomerase/thioredoxin/Tfp pilus assembly protein PilF
MGCDSHGSEEGRLKRVWLLAMLISSTAGFGSGGPPSGNGHIPAPEARKEFDLATERITAKDLPGALTLLRQAIEEDPNYIQAHDKFIEVTSEEIIVRTTERFSETLAKSLDVLQAQYSDWEKRFPNSAGIEYGFGASYSSAEDSRAKPYLLKAVALDPSLSEAYEMLSIDAERWGDDKASRDYMTKAAAADPSNAQYAFYCAYNYHDVDPAKYRTMSLEVAKRFPDSERGAQSLYWLGENCTRDEDRIDAWERARTMFPPQKFEWSASAMSGLYDVYSRTDPAKALVLAKEMATISTGRELAEWSDNAKCAENLIRVRALLASKQFGEASTLLAESKVSRYSSNTEMFALLRADATAGAGDPKAAYEALLTRFAATPEDGVHEALLRYGSTLGKTPDQVDSDVWTLRDSAAKPASAFRLETYISKEKELSLDDFRGKVVLLTFWFPGCGPCRGEFPHFENVLRAFRGKKLAYVGINVTPSQDPYVVPFMHATRYSFIPLRGSDRFAHDAYGVRGEPTNFLIDQQGKIVYQGFRASDPRSEHNLRLMIESLLDRAKAAAER